MHLPRPFALVLGLWSLVLGPWPLLSGPALRAAALDAAQPRPELVERLDAARALFTTRGKSKDAQAAFEQLAATDPKNPDVNFYLGQLANRRDDPAQAQKYFETAVAVAPDDARHHHGLGDAFGRQAQKASIFSQMGLAKKCVAAYERAVALAPTNADFRQSLFEFYRQAPSLVGGGMDKAYAQAAEIKKLDAMRGRICFATLYTADKKYDQALAQFDEVLATTPDDYAALYQVGKLAAVSGQHLDRGADSLRKCVATTPPSPNLPSHANAQWRLGQILEHQKNSAAAKAAYESSLQFDPTFAPARDALSRLNR
ncbi:MAG: tetratricopeptide repeat protein [Verrucomicrobia bacterium]|nr:tetratricopeptide repeat protein [Verrucomicrobiota bacterium]